MADDDQNKHWLGHRDEGTSPLVVLAMSAAKVMLYFLAGLVVLILALLLWQQDKQGWPMARGDWGMIVFLGLLTLACVYVARKIAKTLEAGR